MGEVMARKKKNEEELELELEPTEIDEEIDEDADDESEDISEEESEEEMVLAEEPKARKPRARRAKKAKEPKLEAREVAFAAAPVAAAAKEAAPAKEATPAKDTAPATEVAKQDPALDQIAVLIKQWETSNAALAAQMEKLNQKIPSPTLKAAMSWAPLARVAVGASAISVVLAALSLVFSTSVRQQLLQASNAADQNPAAINRKAEVAVPSARPHYSQEDLALAQIAAKARAEQAELAYVNSKRQVKAALPSAKKKKK
jgi:hypothetical protein